MPGTSMEDLLALLPKAAAFAKPPISNFRVGAIARGTSGKLYYGTNVEFAGEALSFTVHAEQSAVVNAWMSGESGIDIVATSAAPCGYCRQFLNELVTARELLVVMPNESRPLSELLPSSFGPRDLGIDGGLLQPENHALSISDSDVVAQAALRAANMSYAPYSKSFAGIALRTKDGRIFSAAYAENAAFNPSLSPLPAALSQLNLGGAEWNEIAEAVLACVDDLHTNATRTVLAAVGGVALRVVKA
jgi:cytidine deaminase